MTTDKFTTERECCCAGIYVIFTCLLHNLKVKSIKSEELGDSFKVDNVGSEPENAKRRRVSKSECNFLIWKSISISETIYIASCS